jgi:hypothetical protein
LDRRDQGPDIGEVPLDEEYLAAMVKEAASLWPAGHP